MYIIEKLKQLFPNDIEDLEVYDKFLRKYHDEELLYKIFDSEKNNFNWLIQAYSNKRFYTKYMAYYEMSLSFDDDFLSFYLLDCKLTDAESIKTMSLDDKRKLALGDLYDEATEQVQREKYTWREGK